MFLALPTPVASQQLLMVLAKADATAALIAPREGTVGATVEVGIGPHEAACSPDGHTAVVANYGDQRPGSTLTVVDGKAVRTFALRRIGGDQDDDRYLRPHGLAWLPGGKLLAVTSEQARALLLVDVAKSTVVAAIPTEQTGSHMVAIDRDGKRAFTANIGNGLSRRAATDLRDRHRRDRPEARACWSLSLRGGADVRTGVAETHVWSIHTWP